MKKLEKVLLQKYKYTINFAYRTFHWENDTKKHAHVFVVIISFAQSPSKHKYIFADNKSKEVKNINQYLLDAPAIFITGHTHSLCSAPLLISGDQLKDNGNFVLTEAEKDKIEKWLH